MFSVTQNKSLLLIIVTNSILGVLLSVFLNTCLVISGIEQHWDESEALRLKTRSNKNTLIKSILFKIALI